MDVLLEALVDLATIPGPGPPTPSSPATAPGEDAEPPGEPGAGAGRGPGATVPTACGADPMHAAAMRLDYALATPRAAALAAGPARAVDDGETQRLSDHLPVECALDLPGPDPPAAAGP